MTPAGTDDQREGQRTLDDKEVSAYVSYLGEQDLVFKMESSDVLY